MAKHLCPGLTLIRSTSSPGRFSLALVPSHPKPGKSALGTRAFTKPLPPIKLSTINHKVKVKVMRYFELGVNVAVNPYLSSRNWGTLCGIKDRAYYCCCAYVLRISRYSGFLSAHSRHQRLGSTQGSGKLYLGKHAP